MRLIKLLSRAEGVRTLLWTFIKSFQVCNPAHPGPRLPRDPRPSWDRAHPGKIPMHPPQDPTLPRIPAHPRGSAHRWTMPTL